MEKVDLSDVKDDMKAAASSGKSSGPTLAVIEEKIDKLLKYQKTVRALAIVRGIISFIFFLVFIVLPIIGSFYLFRFMQERVDFQKVSNQYKEFYETIGELQSEMGKVSDLKDKLPFTNPDQ